MKKPKIVFIKAVKTNNLKNNLQKMKKNLRNQQIFKKQWELHLIKMIHHQKMKKELLILANLHIKSQMPMLL